MSNSINDNHLGTVSFNQNIGLTKNVAKGAALGAAFSAGSILGDTINYKKGIKALGTKDAFVASEKLAGATCIKGTKAAISTKLAEGIDYDTVKASLENSLAQVKKHAPKRLAKTAAIGAAIFGGLAIAGKAILNHTKKVTLENIKLDVEEHTGEKVKITKDKDNKNQYNIDIDK